MTNPFAKHTLLLHNSPRLLTIIAFAALTLLGTHCRKPDPVLDDTEKPALHLEAPLLGSTQIAGDPITFRGVATDNMALGELTVSIHSGNYHLEGFHTFTLEGKEAEFNFDVIPGNPYSFPSTVQVTVLLTDQSGNLTTIDFLLNLVDRPWKKEHIAVIERGNGNSRFLHILDTNWNSQGAPVWIGDTSLIIAPHSSGKLLLVGNPESGNLTAYAIPSLQVVFTKQYAPQPGLKAITDIEVGRDSSIFITSEIAPYIHSISHTGQPRNMPIYLYQPATAVCVMPEVVYVATYQASVKQGRLKAISIHSGLSEGEFGFMGYAKDIDWISSKYYPDPRLSMIYWDQTNATDDLKTYFFDEQLNNSNGSVIPDETQQVISTDFRFLFPDGTTVRSAYPPLQLSQTGTSPLPIQTNFAAADYDHEQQTILLANHQNVEVRNILGQVVGNHTLLFAGEVESIHLLFNK